MWWTAHFEPQWIANLVPAPSSQWQRIVDLVDADRVARDPVRLISASRSDVDAPIAWLPYLAAERSVDEFDSAWPEARQRAVTKESLPVHQVKGTRPALEIALAAMGYRATVVEWFEVAPRRYPNTFRVSFTIDADRPWRDSDRLAMVRAANKAKNLHTMLEAIEPRREAGQASLYVGGLIRTRHTLRVGVLPQVETIRIYAHVFVGAAVRVRHSIRIRPRT